MHEGNPIADGGFDQMLPDPAKPLPWPTEPEPQPTELDEQVNWLTYPHRELYDMVHRDVDVSGAEAVAAQWAGLGESLRQIGDELRAALDSSVNAWQGTAADKARGTIAALAQWAVDTAASAESVAGCVTNQASSAAAARSQMPEPVDEPAQLISNLSTGATSAASASPFVTGGFSSASLMMQDPLGPSRSTTAHQEAARVMDQFQAESRENYRSVPRFAPPLPKPGAPAPGQQPPGPLPPPAPPTATAAQAATIGSSAAAAGYGSSSARQGMASAGSSVGWARPGPDGAAPVTVSGAGDRPVAPPASARGPLNAGPLGGPMMPPVGGLAGRGGTEHTVKPTLQDDDGLWHLGGPLIPPVIGEGGGHRA
jgi:uncharacterized protein YukE